MDNKVEEFRGGREDSDIIIKLSNIKVKTFRYDYQILKIIITRPK